MLELLPVFFAGAGIFIFGFGAVVGSLIKLPLLRFLAGGSSRVRWSTIAKVSFWEVVILFLSVLALLYRMSSEPFVFQGHPFWFMSVLFGCSTILYCVFGIIPNLYLLGKVVQEDKDRQNEFQKLGYAALLALPTPLFSFALASVLYASAAR
jgi:hypothetical protein